MNAMKEPTAAASGEPIELGVEADFLEDEQADGMVRINEDGVDEPVGLVRAETPLDVLGQDRPFLVGGLTQLLALEGQLVVEQLPLALDRDVLADAHAEGARDEPGHPGYYDDPVVRRRAGDTHHQGEVGHQPVVRTEDDRSKDAVRPCFVGFRCLRQRSVIDRRVTHHGRPSCLRGMQDLSSGAVEAGPNLTLRWSRVVGQWPDCLIWG